ncbi:MAG: VWA domain-containing protein [Planctomycetaceae bacterium]|nr:VWA domain-containing protein [Planctomycetaceae bacterium]
MFRTLCPRWIALAVITVLTVSFSTLTPHAGIVRAAETGVPTPASAASPAEKPAVSATVLPVGVDTFARPNGEMFYALGVAAKSNTAPEARPHDIVVLFDTSASQSGEFREKALTALKSFLDTLSDQERVRLLAVDLSAVPLTESFVAAKSPAMVKALEMLRKRVPLGATDMAGALEAAHASFADMGERVGAVVYIGDGMSTAQLVATPRMQQLVDRYVARRVPISSYAIGPRLDTVMLGILANHTGGALFIDKEPNSGNQAGMELAAAATAEVIWPRDVKLPESLSRALPAQFPPLRLDREAVLIGRADRKIEGKIDFTGELAGQPVAYTWTLSVRNSTDDNGYLVDLVNGSTKDKGLSLPLVGNSALQDISALVGLKTHALAILAQQALATGSYDHAEQLSGEVLRLDATHPEALAIRHAIAKARTSKSTGPRTLKLVNFQVAPEAIPAPAVGPAADGNLLERIQEERKVLEQLMRLEVTTTINKGRAMFGTEPGAAIDLLKLALDKVLKAPELSADTRTQLRNQIEASLMEASRRKIEKDARDVQAQQIASERQNRMQLVRDLQNKEEKLKQLMDRFENLMDERRYGDAIDIAELARREAPRNSAAVQAGQIAENVLAVRSAKAYQEASFRGWQQMMASVDRSSIPFTDDPPVVYPDAESWRLLTERRAKYKNVDLASKKSDNEKLIIETLGKKVTLENLDQIPLRDVIDIIKNQHKIPVLFDTKSLGDAGVQEDVPVTINVKDVTLRSALRVLLRPNELTYLIKDEVLLITTKAAADDIALNGVTKVYPVADLVVPIPQGGLSGFGGLGGSGGGIGGMSGGGGGFGGGGGGGGFGGGGGGGAFAVPAENLDREKLVRDPADELDNLLAFADAPESLKLSGKKGTTTVIPTPAAPAPVAPQTLAPVMPAEPVAIEFQEGEDFETAWDRHLGEVSENPASVRESVRRLMKSKQYDRVVSVISAALRHDQSQPWMYEALGIAMQAGGASPQEIERAMMSVVDFRSQATDLMHVAQYLLKALPGNQTIERRALKLYQQVVALEPTQPQAYIESLQLAQRLNDIEAVQWSTVGILAQAWPREMRDIPALAERVANATHELLKSQHQLDQAERFKKAIDEALIRDCQIVVSWTGNADVDMIIEEPSGMVCSFRNPRTTSGGVMLGDSMANGDDRAAGSTSETYVCAQGFNGMYKMQLRRVWGKTTVDKVTVDYYMHRGSAKERHLRRQISLVDGEASVALELQNGRRTESLEQTQVVNAVAGQMAIGRAILAQQLSALPDTTTPTSNFVPVVPFAQGAVGYQPVIITLPTGANMSAVAVVSADRRYVRVTPQPLFSSIPNVSTFNYSSGSSGSSGGGNSGGSTGAGT